MKIRLFKFLTLFTLLTFSFTTYAIESIDDRINKAFAPIADSWESIVFTAIPLTDTLSVPIVLVVLIGGAVFFT
ncbi:MAG TPA: alanine glycine permease, partial [Pelobium sp.]|nr:alanine glycine permease [Pelobium sp.]